MSETPLERLDRMPTEEDWDSYGAHPVTAEAIATARKVITGEIVPVPMPTVDGGIALEYTDSVALRIEPNGALWVDE
jgi:hypothetical protein